MSNTRRKFIKQTAQAAAGTYVATLGLSAKSYANIIGANDRVRVGVVGFSDRHRSSHMPCFMNL
jgi:protein involved in polysaccharide export with SLBB domain